MLTILIDIDGLRPDVFNFALKSDQIPNIARLLGGQMLERGIQIKTVAPAPSITFCSQASLFTGKHPKDHGIPGNQFFDRFGDFSGGKPRHYAFDVGDTLAVDDAIRVFTEGYASQRLLEPTIYEILSHQEKNCTVAGNMYAKGAKNWLKPDLTNLARFTKGGNLFGMSSSEYDSHMIDQVCDFLNQNSLPDLLTIYFMGLDHESHVNGPQAQSGYLINKIDPLIGKLVQVILDKKGIKSFPEDMNVVIFSDHGQIEVFPDDKHSLKIGFPFDKEMGYFFQGLSLDVHDFPGEDPNCDAVMTLNGGLAYVYLRNQNGKWKDPPEFHRDVLPIGKAFWDAHLTGSYAEDLKGSLSGVLLRSVETYGWHAPFQALTPKGSVLPLNLWFESQSQHMFVDPINRISNFTNQYSGDLLLISNYGEGYYFGPEMCGVHGGLHPEDSYATLVFGCPGACEKNWQDKRKKISQSIKKRCKKENNRLATTADMVTGLLAMIEE